MSRAELHLEIEDAAAGALSSSSSTSPSLLATSLPFVTPISDVSSTTLQTIPESRKESDPEPDTGPHCFHRRRRRWLTPVEDADGSKSHSQTEARDCAARAKLERLVSESEITDEAWAAGVNSVWNGLVNGGRLKKPLPLDIVVKVLKAGWHRDGTWPKGLIVPPSPPVAPLPDELEPNVEENPILPEPVLAPSTSVSAPPTVQERLIRIEGADDIGYLSDASRARLENALEKYDGNLGNLADEDILRFKYDRMVVLETAAGCK